MVKLVLTQRLGSVVGWVASYPLSTVQRVMHLIFEDAHDWRFSEPEPDEVDGDLMQITTWDQVLGDVAIKTSLAVLVQPPWIASQRDLESFAQCTKVGSTVAAHSQKLKSVVLSFLDWKRVKIQGPSNPNTRAKCACGER